MKIIFQGHACAAQGAARQVLFSFLRLRPINAIKNVASSVRSLDGPTFPEVHHGTDTPHLPILPLCLSRTEQRGADTVPQPDLYSGQAVYYIKKVMGLCKSTCPTFLQNFLKPSTTSERQIRWLLGEVKKSVHKHCRTSPQSFKGCFTCSCPSIYSTDIAVHLLVLHLFDTIACNTRWNILKVQPTLQF